MILPNSDHFLNVSIIAAIILGITLGQFYPDLAYSLADIGKIFITLLEMPVLICMLTSIIIGVGMMSKQDAKKIALHALFFIIITLVITKLAIVIIPKALPPIKSIHHYAQINNSIPEISLLDSFIPKNPFKSFADGTTPAIVIFGLFFALALIFVPQKKLLLANIEVLFDASMVMYSFISKLSFIGVFCLATNLVPKTIVIPELIYYYAALAFGAIVISLILLPLFISAFLPVNYMALIKALLPALLLALVSGNIFITMPLIILALKNNITHEGLSHDKAYGIIKTLVPLSLNFPVSGKMVNILFIYFISWYYQDAILPKEELELSLGGLLASFGSEEQSITYLLDVLKLPHDALGIFKSSFDVTHKFMAIARVGSIAFLCFFTATSLSKKLCFKLKTLLLALLLTILSFSAWFYVMTLPKPLVNDNRSASLSIDHGVKHEILSSHEPRVFTKHHLLDSILQSKTLYVGFNSPIKPFAYKDNERLLGHDIELAHMLARDLQVNIIFIPFAFIHLTTLLANHNIDIALSGIAVTKARLKLINFSNSYAQSSHIMVAKDHMLSYVSTKASIKKHNIKIMALAGSSFYEEAVNLFYPLHIIAIDTYDDFLNKDDNSGLYWGSLSASPFILTHPAYGFTNIDHHIVEDIAIALPHDAEDLLNYINEWLSLMKNSGELDELYNKWILAQ